MLSPPHRLRARADFGEVLRRGRRAGGPRLMTHLLLADAGDTSPPRVGLVVGKAVGGSVVRHATSRRLRHLLRARVEQLPAGSRLVVRALSGAGAARQAVLARDLDTALARVLPAEAGGRDPR